MSFRRLVAGTNAAAKQPGLFSRGGLSFNIAIVTTAATFDCERCAGHQSSKSAEHSALGYRTHRACMTNESTSGTYLTSRRKLYLYVMLLAK